MVSGKGYLIWIISNRSTVLATAAYKPLGLTFVSLPQYATVDQQKRQAKDNQSNSSNYTVCQARVHTTFLVVYILMCS